MARYISSRKCCANVTESRDRDVARLEGIVASVTESRDRDVARLESIVASVTESRDRDVARLESVVASVTESRDRDVARLTLSCQSAQQSCKTYALRCAQLEKEVNASKEHLTSLVPRLKEVVASRRVTSPQFAAPPLAASSIAGDNDVFQMPTPGE